MTIASSPKSGSPSQAATADGESPAAPMPAHRLKPLRDLAAGTLKVHEIYRSLQGESTFMGVPCVFVRLTACHLRCTYCDTAHAFHQGNTLAHEDILERVLSHRTQLVEITGGEPLLQPAVHPLMSALADAGLTVLLETSGALDIAPVDPRVRIIMDVKTPGSGEESANFWPNLQIIKPQDEIKFVIGDRADCLWSLDVVRKYDLHTRCTILFSPLFGKIEPKALADFVLETGLPIRFQIQLHKYLWGAETRGV